MPVTAVENRMLCGSGPPFRGPLRMGTLRARKLRSLGPFQTNINARRP